VNRKNFGLKLIGAGDELIRSLNQWGGSPDFCTSGFLWRSRAIARVYIVSAIADLLSELGKVLINYENILRRKELRK